MNLRKLAGFALGPIGTAAVSLITVPVIAWYFPAEDVGRIAMLQVGISFCLLLFSLGLDQAYVREYHGFDNKKGLFKASTVPGLGLLILSLLALLPWPGAISSALFGVHEPLFSLLAGLCFMAAFTSRFLSLILRMQERGLAFSLSQLLPKIGFLLIIGFYAMTASHFNLHQLLIAHTIAVVSVTGVFAWNTRTEWLPRASSLDAGRQTELLRFGLPLVLSGLAFWGMTSMDKIFLRHYASFDELGLYSVTTSFAGAAIVLQSIFSTIWAPTAYKWHTEGADPAAIHRMTDRVLAAVVIFFALAGLLSWTVTFILPAKYHASQYILLASLSYPLLYTLGETTGIGLGIARKSRYAMVAALIALCINIAANRWLVPTHGAAGAACATALSFLALLILRTELASRHWVRVPRTRLYAFTVGCTTLAMAYALVGARYPGPFTALWAALLLSATYAFKTDLAQLAHWLRHNGRKQSSS